jgi:hypothetical protein
VAPRVPHQRVVGGALAGSLAGLVLVRMLVFATDLAPAFATDDRASWQVQAAIEGSDRALLLIPDNAHRPMTLDSAIQKGGGALTEHEPWGSPAVERIFGTQRAYLTGDTLAARIDPSISRYDQTFPTPLDLAPYDLVIYVAIDEDGDDAARGLLAQEFGVTLDGLDCDQHLPAWSPNIVGPGAPFHSSHWTLQATSIVLCRRTAS